MNTKSQEQLIWWWGLSWSIISRGKQAINIAAWEWTDSQKQKRKKKKKMKIQSEHSLRCWPFWPWEVKSSFFLYLASFDDTFKGETHWDLQNPFSNFVCWQSNTKKKERLCLAKDFLWWVGETAQLRLKEKEKQGRGSFQRGHLFCLSEPT